MRQRLAIALALKRASMIFELIPVLSVILEFFLCPCVHSCDLAHPLQNSRVCHDSAHHIRLPPVQGLEDSTHFVGSNPCTSNVSMLVARDNAT